MGTGGGTGAGVETATAARAAGCGETFFTTFVTGITLFGGRVTITGDLVRGGSAFGALAGAVTSAPQAHFAFLPAISGFHRNVLPHPTHENLAAIACSMTHPTPINDLLEQSTNHICRRFRFD